MPTLTQRIQLLLTEAQYSELRRIAQRQGRSMGALVREAIEKELSRSGRERAIAAVEELASLSLPVASWEEMERESMEIPLE